MQKINKTTTIKTILLIIAILLFFLLYFQSLCKDRLFYAIVDNNYESAEKIIRICPNIINRRNAFTIIEKIGLNGYPNCTPLIEACKQQNKDIVMLLLANGADVNKLSEGSYVESALIVSVKKNNYDIASCLIRYGADKTIEDSSGKTAYDYAVELGNQQLLELLS